MFQKLFTAAQIKKIDQLTIERQKITSEALMERAATNLFKKLVQEIDSKQKVYVFCGKGNNGGDALVLTRLLYLHDFDVQCFTVPFSPKASPDFEANRKKLQQINFMIHRFNPDNLPNIKSGDIIIDGIFGTGFSRPAKGIASQAIDFINSTKAKILSIDIPSGLYADRSNNKDDAIIKSTKTYSFQFPKISFFFPENALFAPDFEIVDIGLDASVINEMPTNYYLLTSGILEYLSSDDKFAYKNNFGHAMIIGGQKGMIGAPVLASKAALRIGAGLVTNFLPEIGYGISQTYVPEVMTLTDPKKKYLSKIDIPAQINAVGIGMGMGTRPKTQKAFKTFLKNYHKALLVDADGLNILAQHNKWFEYLPKQSVLTPHPGEFKRLVGAWQNDTGKWQKQKELARQRQLILVLKGAYTTITDGNDLYINPVANTALATAGSGDVLSGIITGLLARGFKPLQAALLGVYIHGQTAENYTKKYAHHSMIASDIIKELKYFLSLFSDKNKFS